MPSPPKRRAPAREVPLAELEATIREALATSGAGLTPTTLKKTLPKSYKKPEHDRALELLRDLAARDEIHRWSKAKKEIFFSHDPIATLDSVVPESLANAPLTAAALKAAVKSRAPGHEDLLTEWLKNALPRRLLFKQGNKYSREPDLRALLKKEIATLEKGLQRLEPLGIDRSRIAEVLLEALALRAAPTTNGTPPTARFLIALNDLAAENPRGALLSLRDLRARLSMSKDEFDETALRLQQEGAVSLHHHDHPLALPEAERAALVRDRSAGEHYVGIALKEQEGP